MAADAAAMRAAATHEWNLAAGVGAPPSGSLMIGRCVISTAPLPIAPPPPPPIGVRINISRARCYTGKTEVQNALRRRGCAP